MEYTTSRPVPGLSGLRPLPGDIGRKIADLIWNLKVPVGAVWKLLPWNGGRAPSCAVKLVFWLGLGLGLANPSPNPSPNLNPNQVYLDGDMRIVQDPSGDYFVYTRPVCARSLDEKLAKLSGF